MQKISREKSRAEAIRKKGKKLRSRLFPRSSPIAATAIKAIHAIGLIGSVSAVGALHSESAWALDQIIRPYQGVRTSGMGGVLLTTGLYDQNFFGNPARVTANPTWRITILDPTVEFNTTLPGAVSSLSGGSDFYRQLGDKAGQNYHARVQTTMPAFYIPNRDGKWAFAFGVITSSQVDVDLRRSLNIDPTGIVDIGPAFTVGRRLLEENELSIGLTSHLTYRLATNSNFSFIDLIQGKSLSPSKTGGQGAMIDFDLGSTYDFHWHPLGMDLSAAFAINNLLGGKYSNISLQPIETITSRPTPQPRSAGFGVSARKKNIGVLKDTMVAMEVTDIGNNSNGSMFRTVHLGAETTWTVFSVRAGVNQGYLAAGLGIDLRVLMLDFATYGEEMGLNPGLLEDRRYAVRLAIQI